MMLAIVTNELEIVWWHLTFARQEVFGKYFVEQAFPVNLCKEGEVAFLLKGKMIRVEV